MFRAAMKATSQAWPHETGQTAEPWVAVGAVAAHLGVRKDSIYRWIENRGLPAQKIGKLWKLKLSEVDAWVRTHGTGEESPAGALTPQRAKQPRRDSSPERAVLVIDDDALVRETIGDFLSDEGFLPLLASDGVGERDEARETEQPGEAKPSKAASWRDRSGRLRLLARASRVTSRVRGELGLA